jgi:hypothetical protein
MDTVFTNGIGIENKQLAAAGQAGSTRVLPKTELCRRGQYLRLWTAIPWWLEKTEQKEAKQLKRGAGQSD